MNNDLIKRIDDWLPYADEESGILASLLRDCRAEIERLNTVLEVTDENHGRTTVLAHKALKDLDKAKAEIERLSKPYVPMTDNQIDTITLAQWRNSNVAPPAEHRAYVRAIEAAVIKRSGLEIKHD